MSTKVAIVILNWNGCSYLERYLPPLLKYSPPEISKIYVADNHSTDSSVEFLETNYPEIGLIRFPCNYGFAKGYALALPQIQAKYYVLLNSDVEVTENWLGPIIDMMDRNEEIAAAMPKMLSFHDRDKFEYAGAGGGFIDRYGYPFCRGRILTKIEIDKGQYNDTCEIFWASGACMFLRSEAYSRTGGLDGDFFAHMEEIDLCWRLKRLGYKIYFCGESKVYHVGGGTLPNDNPRKLYYNYRNSLFLLFKNITTVQFLTVFLPRMLLDGISALAYLAQGKGHFFMSVVRAHLRFYINLWMLVNKRRIFNRIIDKKQVQQVYPGSIVFSFFIKGNKRFDQLDFTCK
jgi:GT2 family glycosyltransferase